MIGPVSGTGRAMMSSLQQQMQKGMPVDQAIQYVKSMAQDGVAPLVDLYAMLNQFQRLKQQQVQPPQTPPTVRDQISMMAQQGANPQQVQAQPQSQMQGGIAGMQAPAPAPQPMDRGLGAIDAGRMEYPKFAGGGVVALANGGDVEDEETGLGSFFTDILKGFSGAAPQSAVPTQRRASDITQAVADVPDQDIAARLRNAIINGDEASAVKLQKILYERNRDDLITATRDITGKEMSRAKKATETQSEVAALGLAKPAPTQAAPARDEGPARKIKKPSGVAGPAAAPEKPEMTLDERIAEMRDPLMKRGILTKDGKSVATQEFRQYLAGEDARMKEQFGKDKALALAEAGFRMAGAASRPGATFLGALAEGGVNYSQAVRGMNKELEANRRQMAQQKYMLDKADEADARGDVDKALTLRQQAETRMFELQKHRDNLMVDYAQINASREATAESREMRQTIFEQGQRADVIDRMKELRDSDMEYGAITREMAKANEKDLPALQAKLAQVNQRLYSQATGADLPGMGEADVGTASRGAANLGSDDEFFRAIQERGLSLKPLTPPR